MRAIAHPTTVPALLAAAQPCCSSRRGESLCSPPRKAVWLSLSGQVITGRFTSSLWFFFWHRPAGRCLSGLRSPWEQQHASRLGSGAHDIPLGFEKTVLSHGSCSASHSSAGCANCSASALSFPGPEARAGGELRWVTLPWDMTQHGPDQHQNSATGVARSSRDMG